ncbi:translation repressor RelE [Advenella kashmirensis W13003]|uniref:Translation repressor RelE n=1 Tax=Advenella kashmirensis W13003 TaxID=1424334 RepID=V8QZ03_9BURK|nr:type II toxin-antitoxin system RelE/ParE family toxin [Advenella kashmirensis]ETF04535.1 translation repressor RelE [Advenella kashmirensis W13003]
MELFWTIDALDDRDRIYSYVENDSPRAALSLDEQFEKGAALLSRYPHIGRPGRVPDTFELVVHANYLLVYDLVSDQVRILRVVHTATRWPG